MVASWCRHGGVMVASWLCHGCVMVAPWWRRSGVGVLMYAQIIFHNHLISHCKVSTIYGCLLSFTLSDSILLIINPQLLFLQPIPVLVAKQEKCATGSKILTETEPGPDWDHFGRNRITSLKKLTGFNRIGRIFTGCC